MLRPNIKRDNSKLRRLLRDELRQGLMKHELADANLDGYFENGNSTQVDVVLA
jgi:hypothetical protein